MASTKRSKTVLVQVNSLALGGTQLNAVDFAWALEANGYRSVLLAPRDTLPNGPSLFDFAAERGVQLEAFDRPRTVIEGAHSLRKVANRINADLVHVYGAWAARFAYWGPCALGRRPLVLTDYEMALSPDTFRSPQLIVGTGYLADELAGRRGPTTLISPPVDLSRDDPTIVDGAAFRRGLGLSERQVVAVLVSRLDQTMKYEGIKTAIASLEQVHREHLTLVIVGTGDMAQQLKDQGEAVNRELGRSATIFTGPLSDPRPAYAAADVSLGMGGSAARALAFGNPLVVLGERGWSETFRPETMAGLYRNSFWSDEREDSPVERLSTSLRELVDFPRLRKELSVLGRQFAAQNFGLAQMAGKLAACYEGAGAAFSISGWLHDFQFEARAAGYRLTPPRFRSVSTGPSSYKFKLNGTNR